MLPSSGYTRLNTLKNLSKLAYVPDGILALVPHEIARYGALVSKKKEGGRGSDSRETKVLVKASRAHSPIFEYQPHVLLLTASQEYRKKQGMRLIFKYGTVGPRGLNQDFSFT